jgi:tRNA pseudouridine13 synthase
LTGTTGAFVPIPRDLPFAWDGPAGGGRIRVQPEDFRVTELPLATPAGDGEHCWLYVRKRNSNTEWVARQLARFAGVSAAAVSWAGLKDRNALTEQWFSVHLPGRADPAWYQAGSDQFQVLLASRHARKLRTGALRGNRFAIRVRDVEADPAQVDARLRQIAGGGFPNAFGPQRFGHAGGNLAQAAQLFADPRRRIPRHRRGLALSAVRAALFNRVLAARIDDSSWTIARPGEALQLAGKSACFVAGEIDDSVRQRLRDAEVNPTGPLCGRGEPLVRGVAAEYETNVLAPYRDWIDGLDRQGVDVARRALRIVPGELRGEREADGSWLIGFYLPAGAYATSLLRELFALEGGE